MHINESHVFTPFVEGAVGAQEHCGLPGLHHQRGVRQRVGGADPHGVL